MPTRPTTLSSTPVTVSRAAPWRPHRTSSDARESGTSSARLRFQPPPTHTHGGRPGTLGWASVRECHPSASLLLDSCEGVYNESMSRRERATRLILARTGALTWSTAA
jgi:hypothetical protein